MVHKSDAMLIIFEAEKEGSARYPYFEAMKKAETQPYPIF
jgi:uncharacterized phage-like protein YoqJ